MLAAVAHTLDRVRSPMIGAVLGRSPALRGIAADRRARLAVGGAIALVVALAASVAAPAAWYVWAPLVLGVPHVLGDVRYLLLGPHRRIALGRGDLVLAGGLVAVAVVTSPVLGAGIVLGAAALTRAADRKRQASALVVAAGFGVAAWVHPVATGYAVLHGHNLVALVAFAAIAPRGVGRGLAAGALAITGVILAGGLDPVLPFAQLDGIAGYVLPDAAFAAWPPALCARVAASFVFLQSVHYAMWLRMIPAAARRHAGLRGFGASLRALERDCTAPGVAAAAIATLALIGLGLAGDAPALRDRYVQLAGGHAYLELAVLLRWFAGPRP